MQIEIGLWIIPLVLTIVGYLLTPRRKLSGDYDFGIDNTIYFLMWLLWTLFVWLVFFAVMHFLA